MEEGRVRIVTPPSQGGDGGGGGAGYFVYDYFLSDHLGNTRVVLTDDYNVSGPIIEAAGYYPHGLKMAAIGYKAAIGVANPSQYQGGFSDFEEETGWNSFALRNYDPQTGRFVQQGPFDQFASGYTGMGNDPVNNADPSGGLSVDFGTLGQVTGSMLVDRALITLAGAAAGYGIDRAMGGNGWKGAAIGGSMLLSGTFLPPVEIGGAAIADGATQLANGGAQILRHTVEVSTVTTQLISHSMNPESLSASPGISINPLAPPIIDENSSSSGITNILRQINPGGNMERIAQVANLLSTFMVDFGINTKLRQAHFFAQISHETGGFYITRESYAYSRDRLLEIFPKYFNESNVGGYIRSPRIFDRAYAHRMGNGPEASGDGSQFRGSGITQLTGRDNYMGFTQWNQKTYGGTENFITNPSLISTNIRFYVLSGLWDYSINLGLNKYADKDNILQVTKHLNGGYNGMQDRMNKLKRAKIALKL